MNRKLLKIVTGGVAAGLAYTFYKAWRERQLEGSEARPSPHRPSPREDVGRWESEGGNVPRSNLGTHSHPVRDGRSTTDESPPSGSTH